MSEQLDTEQRKGRYAQELLDNPVFQELWIDFEKQIVRELKGSSPRDAAGREKCILLLQLMEKLRAMVQETVYTGKMATITLERERTLRERAKEWIGRDGLIRSQ